MYDLTITHTGAEGTLIEGTSKGDGTAQILKAHGWRWFRSIGMWGIPRSRDRHPNYNKIHGTRDDLARAGFTVAAEITDEVRSTAEVEADKIARQADRVTALQTKADKAAAEAEASYARAHELGDRIPFGQPALNDAMRRTYDKLHRLQDKAGEAYQEAEAAAAKLEAAEPTTGARYAPSTVANRIDRIEADIRDRQRRLAGYRNNLGDVFAPATGSYADRLQGQLTELRDQLTYWQQVRVEQVASGEANNYGPDTIQAGDQVQLSRSGWWTVRRANKKTVTVESHGCSSRAPYHQIKAHQPSIDHEAQP